MNSGPGFIRRFMFVFGPISPTYDFATFAVMIYGFLPLDFLAVLALMVVTYLALVELGKYVFFTRLGQAARPLAMKPPDKERRVQRRAAGWSLQRPSLPKRPIHVHPPR
jgi:hypothetical protein